MHSHDIPEVEECQSAPVSPTPQYTSRREARAAEAAAAASAAAPRKLIEPTRRADARADVIAVPRASAAVFSTAAPELTIARAAAATSRRSSRAITTTTTATTASSASAPTPAKRRSIGRSLLAAATLTIVSGLVATAAIPSYAGVSTSSDAQLASAAQAAERTTNAQSLTVSASAAGQNVQRDAFAAPTTEQLLEATKQAAVLSAASATGTFRTIGSSAAVGDDYPWPNELTDVEGGDLSALGYYYRECVDFVAWRLNRDRGSVQGPWALTWGNMTPAGGSAYEWPDNWADHGWATSSTPIVGSVAWFTYNHVAYVQAVNGDGTVTLEEYNYGGKHTYGVRTIAASDVNLFLYPPS